MHSLRDHLLKAGLVTQEQVTRVEEQKNGRRKKRRPPKKNGAGAAPRQDPKKQPVNRMLDLSDPKRLEIAQAIEAHKVRGETTGEVPFHFALRDGRVRKMFVSKEMQSGLENGQLAIVENGDADVHVIVASDALPAITAVDAEAVRFHNKN